MRAGQAWPHGKDVWDCTGRKMPGARDSPGFAQEVLQAAEEGMAAEAAAAAKGLPSRTWQIPVSALFALQKKGWVMSVGVHHAKWVQQR